MLHVIPTPQRWMTLRFLFALAVMGINPLLANGQVKLAQDGVTTFDIVVPDVTDENAPPTRPKPFVIEFGNPHTSISESANLLAHYLQAATGATFTVRRESNPVDKPAAIHLGPTRFATTHLADRATDLDHDGFVHDVVDSHNIILYGGSTLGTEFAVYDFLERYVGVRWLFPGELGEHIPAHDTLTLPRGMLRDEPKFLSRYTRPHRVEGGLTWAKRLRTHLRVEFHHNIPKIFPARLTREHPELYPIIDGKRYLPPKTNIPTWHPCYTAPRAAEITAELLTDFFRKYPEYNSVALGISDANESRNCHCPTCVSQYPKVNNTLGFADRSNVYYQWCNDVIAKVRAQYPNKYFGCIAYRGVTDPPRGFKVDEHLVPFLCFDRMLWADPARESQDRQLTESWSEIASELGWYDYLYGRDYVLPRIYSRTLQRSLQFAYTHKVRHYYGEAYHFPDWHEGPKFYIALKLLWNPDANVDTLLADWCEAAVGAEAAPDLVRYFNFLEDFWTQRVPQTAWFSDRSKIYLIFNTLGYLDALTHKDITQCSKWLNAVVANAGKGKQKQRAKHFRKSFESRRRETIDYFMVNNQIPTDPARTRDIKRIATLDFNDKPSVWEPFSSENEGTWHWEPSNGRNGSGAFRLDNATSVIRRGTAVDPRGKYRINGWYKFEGALPDAARLEMIIEWRDQNRDEFRVQKLSKLLPVTDNTDWQPFTMAFTPPRLPGRVGKSLGISFNLRYAVESSVLIDDITVTQIAIKK